MSLIIQVSTYEAPTAHTFGSHLLNTNCVPGTLLNVRTAKIEQDMVIVF